MGHFKGYFEGAKTFLTPKLSRAQWCIGIFVSLLIDNLVHVSLLLFEIQFFEIRLFLHTERNVLMLLEETPPNIPVWQKIHQSIPQLI
jgi:hypothetical protein